MYNSLASVKQAISNGTSVEEITQYFIQKIEENKHINAFLEVFVDSAMEKAKEVDAKIKNGTQGKLAGMVIGIKDNMAYKNHKVSGASKILEGFESIYTATAVERLINEDAVIIGRLNCDEFAMGSSNEKSAYGPVLNPLNEKLVPGGSSGGSAAALAAGLCTATLGSDTGGSIRQPASFTGTIGFKPTYGKISRYGLLAYASSFDQIGTFTNKIEDAAILTQIMGGKDEFDSTLLQEDSKPINIHQNSNSSKKIAVLKDCIESEGLNPEIKSYFLHLIEDLKSKGHQVEMVDFPYLNKMIPTYYVLTTAEASSNLARYSGVHFGKQTQHAEGIEQIYKKSRSEGFGTEVKRRIMLGTFVLSSGFYDAYYTKAQKVRRLIQNKTSEILNQHDLILLPTAPSTAFELNGVKDPIQMYLQDIFTVQANLSGNPAISLPLGKNSENLPFGVQFIGKHFEEENLLSFSNYMMNHF